jgi:LAO/AO transport system kinase
MSGRGLSVAELEAGVRAGDRSLVARAITLVESNRADHHAGAQELLQRLLPHTGGAHRVGISGVPGVGKSTFIEALGVRLTDAGHRVAVLAVDPSSSLTGGSILGDKTRMGRLATDERAFIRPSPTGGSLGGVARKTRETILVCEAAGFDVVLVETVGVGQSETLVAEMVDFFLLLNLAGAGDELQGIKRGILELADLIAITKADGDNLDRAQRARADLAQALQILRPSQEDRWAPRVLTCSAVEGKGIEEIWRAVLEHREQLVSSGAFETRRRQQLIRWMWSLVEEGLREILRRDPTVARTIELLEQQILEARITPTAAAAEILAAFRRH